MSFHPLIFSILNSQTHNILHHVFSPLQDCSKSIEFGAKKREPGKACNEKKFPYLFFCQMFNNYISGLVLS